MKNSDKRAKQLCRVGEIIGMLIEREKCTRPELAAHFELSERTIQRDIDFLSVLFPVYYDRGAESYVLDKDYSFKDINLASDEIKALLMCRIIASNLGEPVSGPIDSLMKKLKVEMGKKGSELIGKVSTNYAFDMEQMENIPQPSSYLEAIQDAVEINTTLAIKYMSGEDEVAKTFDPYGLFFRLGMWYVVACDHQNKEIEILPLLRIKDVKKTDNSYRIPSDFSVDAYVKAHPDKVHKEDLKELHKMLEWLDSLNTMKELTGVKIHFHACEAEYKRLIEKIRQIQTTINERTVEIRRLEAMKNEGKRINTELYEDLKALNYADATEVEEHTSILRRYYRPLVERGVVWDRRDNLSMEEVETILKDAGKRINRISVSKEFKNSAFSLGNMELERRMDEISREIVKLESIAKR